MQTEHYFADVSCAEESTLLQNIPVPGSAPSGAAETAYYKDSVFFGNPVYQGVQPERHPEVVDTLWRALAERHRERWVSHYPSGRTTSAGATPARRLVSDALNPWLVPDAKPAGDVLVCVLGVEVRLGVLQFCARSGILEHLFLALDCARSAFPSAVRMDVILDRDPEDGTEYVRLAVTTSGEIDEVLDAYDTYTQKWLDAVPYPESGLICLTYSLI